MIYQILTTDNCFTTNEYVADWAPQLKGQFHLIPIQFLHEAERLPVGTYIFSDIERLTDAQRLVLTQVYDQLEAHGPPMRLLNGPTRSKARYELLKTLHQKGINNFRAFRPDELPSDLRFPVFIRVERDHKGAATPLLNSQKELEQAFLKTTIEGLLLRDLLVVEFCDTRDSEGLYRRYNAYRIGDRIIPRGMAFSDKWQIKGKDKSPVWRTADKTEYFDNNPYQDQLMEVFRIAGIEYGRVDYGVKDGRVQIWEINTSPQFSLGKPEQYTGDRLAFHQRAADSIADAFEAIGQPTNDLRVPIKLSWNIQPQPTYS